MVGPIRQKVKEFFLQNDLFFFYFLFFFVEIAQKKQHFYKHTIFNPTILSHLYKYCFFLFVNFSSISTNFVFRTILRSLFLSLYYFDIASI